MKEVARLDTGLSILVVTPTLPYPPMWGFGIRVYQLIRHLAQRHRVSLFAYGTKTDAAKVAALSEFCESVHTVSTPQLGRLRRRTAQLASTFSLQSYHGQRLRSPEFQRALDQVLSSQSFDVVQIESSPLASFDFAAGPLLVVDEHNLEYELIRRQHSAERFWPRKAYAWLEHLKVRREEHRCWHRMHGCVLTSEREREIVGRLAPAVATRVVPNGVDLEYFSPVPNAPDPNRIVFTGLLRYRPNADAVVYFVRQVLPHIVRARPGVVFTVVGWGGAARPELRGLAGPNVTFTGRVPDVRPYLAEAGAVVVPLRVGSGTRLKVLEALAMARPVVSTSLGCEGISLHNGDDVLIADDPRAFAAAVLQVLGDLPAAARLGRNGRALVEREFGWDSVVYELERFYQERLAYAGRGPALEPTW